MHAPVRAPEDLIDVAALARDLEILAASAEDVRGSELKNQVRARLKAALGEGRVEAERRLLADGDGVCCAARLSALQDAIIRALADVVVAHVYPADNPSQSERLAIVAVGGYGRGTLAPGSDIDLLFLLPYKQTAWGESVVEYLLYMLWDLGQKVGHATRSVDESIRQCKADMTIRTAVLEARLLWGEQTLFDELAQRFDREIAASSGAEFVAAKLAERNERHRRAGNTRYLVEPNVKDGKGGQRDLHTLHWIGKYLYRVRHPEDLVAAGVYARSEHRRFAKCEAFLWTVRCHLHFAAGRAEERLSFDMQPVLASRMGYTSRASLRAVERFMKHYFLVAKTVGDLTRIFAAALEAQQVKPVPLLNRFMWRLTGPKIVIPREFPDYRIDNNRLGVKDDAVFARDPVHLVRIFYAADHLNLTVHPDALKLITRSLKLIDRALLDDAEANRLFLDILTSRNQPETVLRMMNEAGVLGRFVPDFGRIVAMMQFNMYHHYTVDEHLLRCIGVLSEIDKGRLAEDHPLATEIFPTVQSRRALYVALFLHDIAKGRPEDHSVAGADVARRLCPRLGLAAAETETVVWLVREHLTMSQVAQSRDLSDPRTIADFAMRVQSLERLKLLLILTVADIRAVGPGVWNGWKGQLLRTLYYETEPVLAGGHSRIARNRRIAQAQAALRAELSSWPKELVERIVERHGPAYWMKTDLARQVQQAQLMRAAWTEGRTLATAIRTDAFRAITELTVHAPDHPRLLATIAGCCAAAGANIVDAQIFTTNDGHALDTIFLSRAFDREEDEVRRAQRIAASVEQALEGRLLLPQAVAERARRRTQPTAFTLEPDVLVNNAWSEQYTVVEVSGLDRPGLLYDLTTAISDLGLDIGSAHVATFGERAVDVFYVTDLDGAKIEGEARQHAIRDRLLAVFRPTAGAA
jgi:[protein-PII] uridylyltransferase